MLRLAQKTATKEGLRNYQKVIRSSLRDATYYFGFLDYNPAQELQIPKTRDLELKKIYRPFVYTRRNQFNFRKIYG